MPWKLVADPSGYIFTWLIDYSAFLGPVGGIMIADYFVMRRRQLNVGTLYDGEGEYRYTSGISLVAVVAFVFATLAHVQYTGPKSWSLVLPLNRRHRRAEQSSSKAIYYLFRTNLLITGPKNMAITSRRKVANEKLCIKTDCSNDATHQTPWLGVDRKANKKTEATMGIAKQKNRKRGIDIRDIKFSGRFRFERAL